MKAKFILNKAEYIIKVPKYLIHINNLTNALARNEDNKISENINDWLEKEDTEDDIVFMDSFEFLVNKCTEIFTEKLELNYNNFSCGFLNPDEKYSLIVEMIEVENNNK